MRNLIAHVFLCSILWVSTSRAEVTFMNSTLGMRLWCANTSCLGQSTYSVVVGQSVTFSLTAIDIVSPIMPLTLTPYNDPGLPNGATLSATKTMTVQANFANISKVENFTVTYRNLTFTPQRRQEALRYNVCFRAYWSSDMSQNATYCVVINVGGPKPSFSPLTKASSALTLGVGCPVIFDLVGTDASGNGYCTVVHAGARNGSYQLPPGAMLVYQGPHPAVPAPPRRGTFDGCGATTYQLVWYPARGQETKSYSFCVNVQDKDLCMGLGCVQRAVERCFAVNVVKCRYCLGAGETLMAAAAKYATDWIQVWGANPFIVDPDDVAAWTELQLGPTYTVRAGDTLQRIADRFGTTPSNIVQANIDLPPAAATAAAATVAAGDATGVLPVGAALCVMPAVCWAGLASTAAGAFLVAPAVRT